MKFKKEQRKIDRTPDEQARIEGIREQFQKNRPTIEQILKSGDYTEPVPLGIYLEAKALLLRLKQEREKAGLSLGDIANLTGMDKAAISRLENGHQPNPTFETLVRYARALGKQIVWTFADLSTKG